MDKRISRWFLVKLVLKTGLYMVLVLAGWGLVVWGSFLLAFPFGLIVSGLSLFNIAWVLNRVIEGGLRKETTAYMDSVFPAGDKIEGSKERFSLGMPAIPDDWEGWDEGITQSELNPLFKSSIDEGEAAEYMGVKSEEDVIIEHEVSENGVGDMVFEFEEAEGVELDPVDQEIDDILQGEK